MGWILYLAHYWRQFLLCTVSSSSTEVRSHHEGDSVSLCDLGFTTMSSCSKEVLQRDVKWCLGER